MMLFRLGFAFTIALCAGCRSTSVNSSTGAPMPLDPVAAPATPAVAPVTNIVALSPYSLADLDGNGFASEFPVAVYLYSQPHPAPSWRSGRFTLSVSLPGDAEDEPLAQWEWDDAAALALRETNLVGAFYRFQIDLKKLGIDSIPGGEVEYRIAFDSAAQSNVVYSSRKTIRSR